MKKIPILLAASTLAVIALVLFQVNWLQHSRKMMEEDFSHRVHMALCSAVENYPGQVDMSMNCALPNENNAEQMQGLLQLMENDSTFEQTLADAFTFYKIDLDYEISVTKSCLKVCNLEDEKAVYQCCASPYDAADEYPMVNLLFPQKECYFTEKMRFMTISSLLILLFITSIFIWANYSLWKQQKISEINVDFFNNMAHEFRTPLTNIGLAMKLAGKKNEALKDNKYLNIVQKENQKLLCQVERVLHLAKIENGEYHLQKEAVQIRELVEEVLSNMHLQIEERKAEISTENITANLVVYADKLHLGNVFRNLIENALKYSGESPKIKLSTEVNEQGVRILFQDNGIGISPSEQPYIFEKFHRSTKGNLHHQKGFGLGLAYVKMIVELHKGFVRIISDLQKGSRFEIFLPNSPQIN